MTKLREPLTYQHTLTRVAALLGWDRCAAICGVSTRAVRNWSDHDCETEVRMIDAERLDRAFLEHGGDHAPFQRLFTLRLDIATREVTASAMASLASAAAKETGEAVAAMIDAAANSTSASARRTARRELEEALDALKNGIAALDGLDRVSEAVLQ
ncbi:hypothetical protein [Aurantiacibacter suaedae]|uniref:hypothetical protein n=1 Tax=Aurantiacibacter suaedae TaxID=2545755 RepID=UPI0010F5EBCA|nr:hypothetical protein [Aurantiacibacter suaedae]